MNANMKDWIDKASYESLLSKWRNAPIGSPWLLAQHIARVYKPRAERVEETPDGR